MKCLICNKELTGNVCERCGFPKISVVGGAEDDPVVKTAVHDYKENILKKITVEMKPISTKKTETNWSSRRQTGFRLENSYRIWIKISVPGFRRTSQEWKPVSL